MSRSAFFILICIYGCFCVSSAMAYHRDPQENCSYISRLTYHYSFLESRLPAEQHVLPLFREQDVSSFAGVSIALVGPATAPLSFLEQFHFQRNRRLMDPSSVDQPDFQCFSASDQVCSFFMNAQGVLSQTRSSDLGFHDLSRQREFSDWGSGWLAVCERSPGDVAIRVGLGEGRLSELLYHRLGSGDPSTRRDPRRSTASDVDTGLYLSRGGLSCYETLPVPRDGSDTQCWFDFSPITGQAMRGLRLNLQ